MGRIVFAIIILGMFHIYKYDVIMYLYLQGLKFCLDTLHEVGVFLLTFAVHLT
jgi:hypothetical protein